jgi:hypothetical protein
MSLSLLDMRSLVRKGLGNLTDTDQGGSDAEVDQLLNLSLWELEAKFPFKEKECKVTISTIAGEERYQLPSFNDALISVAVIVTSGSTSTYHKLTRSSADNFHDERQVPSSTASTTNRGQPLSFYRRNNFLILDPVPDKVYSIEMILWKTVASLLEGAKEVTGLPQNWDEIVVVGAVTKGHFFAQDYNLARQAKDFQLGYIRSAVPTEAKEERDSRYAGLQVIDELPNERDDTPPEFRRRFW